MAPWDIFRSPFEIGNPANVGAVSTVVLLTYFCCFFWMIQRLLIRRHGGEGDSLYRNVGSVYYGFLCFFSLYILWLSNSWWAGLFAWATPPITIAVIGRCTSEVKRRGAVARERAWQLLSELLTPQQQVEVNSGWVTEQGTSGRYYFPLTRRLAHFSGVLPVAPHTRQVKLALCFVDTAPEELWHDAVATFLLYIRSGREVELFRRGTWKLPN